MTSVEALLLLVGSEVCERKIDGQLFANSSEDFFREIYALSKKHDLGHLVGSALSKLGLPLSNEILAPFRTEHFNAVFKYRRYGDELSQISALFESEGLFHIPLKGSVLRDYYPEGWMRTSCDLDILVKPYELERAKNLLIDVLGYSFVAKTSHDISFDSPTGVHLELHFALVEDYILSASHNILESVWERTHTAEGKKYTLLMTDEMFYFYHIVHMAKHIVSGGCGIRPLLDHWILENRVKFDSGKRAALISEGGFSEFEAGIRELCAVWFEGREHTDFTRSLENYILSGGAYGTVENGVVIGVVKRKGRLGYVLVRIFPPYHVMKNMYPTLEKRKWLIPFYHVRRWLRIIFKGRAKHAKVQFEKSKNITDEEYGNAEKLLTSLGLLEK